MIATLVGFRVVDFEDSTTGRRISGTSLYIVYDSDSRGLIGQLAGKVFYAGNVDPTWLGQAVKLEYSCDPCTKSMKLIDVTLA